MTQFDFTKMKDELNQFSINPGSYTMEELLEFSNKINQLESDQNDKNNRDNLTRIIFQFIAFWMICILIILIYTGKGDLNFSDSVIITLISTTTANVLGFGIIVANYLFKQGSKNNS